MNVWAKLITALRGSANEIGEAIVDTQALRILDQEIREAAEELKNSQDSLAEIMARQKVAEEKSATLSAKITEYENYAMQALQQQDEGLAKELADQVAELENKLHTEQEAHDGYQNSANSLRKAIKSAENNLKRLKHQVDTVKATENVQRAQAAVAQRHSGADSRLRTAMDSLQRIKDKQELRSAQFSAAQELAQEHSEDSLHNRLEAAGIVADSRSGEAVLARLKSNLQDSEPVEATKALVHDHSQSS